MATFRQPDADTGGIVAIPKRDLIFNRPYKAMPPAAGSVLIVTDTGIRYQVASGLWNVVRAAGDVVEINNRDHVARRILERQQNGNFFIVT
jgi:hypothetical protein